MTKTHSIYDSKYLKQNIFKMGKTQLNVKNHFEIF